MNHKIAIKRFKKGNIPWNKGKKGVIKPNSGSFKKGHLSVYKGKKRPELSGINHWRWMGGLPKCVDCGIQLGTYVSKRCFKCNGKFRTGSNSQNWKGGLRKKKNERNDSLYQWWVGQVKKRDKNECIFKGQNCSGKIIIHHILSFTRFPELRYEIKNGITLCQYHHPRKRVDEQRLIPFFQEMVISRELI
jgi:hypothetical protein